MANFLVIDEGENQSHVVWLSGVVRAWHLVLQVVPAERQAHLWCGVRRLEPSAVVLPHEVYRLRSGGLAGGKGGFGAMLRSMGKAGGGKATRDFGACRDLQGRRLRHVNDQIALERWHESRTKKESHGIKGWYLDVPSWAELPRVRKSKSDVRKDAKERSWREEEEDVLASGVETRHFTGKVTFVDSRHKGFCVVDSDCYVPMNANTSEIDDWRDLRLGDRLEVWAAHRPNTKHRNSWTAYKARRVKAPAAQVSTEPQRRQPARATAPDVAGAVAAGLAKRQRVKESPAMLPVGAESSTKAPTPLVVAAGRAKLDGVAASGDSEFCSLVAKYAAGDGTWYYEARLVTDGVMQLGWSTSNFAPDESDGDGAGDDDASWAFDGCRQRIWTAAEPKAYGDTAWTAGDIIGCLLDRGALRFSRNGRDLGVAFEGLPSPLFATISLEDNEAVVLAFDRQQMRFLPPGASPLAEAAVEPVLPRAIPRPEETLVVSSEPQEESPPKVLDEAAASETRAERQPPEQEQAPTDAAARPTEQVVPPAPPKRPEVVPEALDLADIESVMELEALGLDRLKSALLFAGCKCGGTLQERAARLWSTKGKARAAWDPKILARRSSSQKPTPTSSE